MPEELWTKVHNSVQAMMIKTIPKEMRCKEAKWLAEEASQIPEKRRKGKIYSTECRVPENSKER